MKKEDLSLYFIALVPQEPTYAKVVGLKEEIQAGYESKAALRSPPHITLHMPFKWKHEKEAILYKTLEQVASDHHSFKQLSHGKNGKNNCKSVCWFAFLFFTFVIVIASFLFSLSNCSVDSTNGLSKYSPYELALATSTQRFNRRKGRINS